MADRIPEATLAEIRARINIVELISGYVALRKAGRSYVGLCPFHSEKTPSFSVNEEGGFFHCFGCGAGGNAFTFVTKVEGLTFPEAVRSLATKAGVDLPQSRDPQAQERARLYHLNELASAYFQSCLWGNAGGDARRYLDQRGLQQEIVKQFGLGFAPPWSGGLVRFLTNQRADLQRAASLGLIGKRDNGGYYDKFRHRLMFPITDVVGKPVGFGGRLLPQGEQLSRSASLTGAANRPPRSLPKYLNSSDSVVYKKGTLLYGLAQAKATIQACGRTLVVEGYTDLLALVQNGHAEAVAVLGTALTAEQLKLLRRFTREVYFFFDGDEAGRRAAMRAYPLCIEAEVNGRGIFLPQGEDPDSFARAQGLAGLDEAIAQAEPLEDFYFQRHAPPPGASAFQRAQAAQEALRIVKPMSDVVARGALVSQIAQRFGVSEEDLRRSDLVRQTPQAPSRRGPSQANWRQQTVPPDPSAPSASRRQHAQSPQAGVETELLYLMLIDRQLALRAAKESIVVAFQHWQPLAAEIVAAWQAADQIDVGTLLDKLPQGLADRVSRAYVQEPADEEADQREQLFSDCVERIRMAQRKSGRERLQQEIREAEHRGDDQGVRLRLQQLQDWDSADKQ